MSANQVLTAAQMRAAEQELFDQGVGVSELMETAASGAAEWIRRIAVGRSVTVLCGPGNNGGDGYVIARLLREVGNAVRVVAPLSPKTDAARAACDALGSRIIPTGERANGDVFVDCLFGTGLSRPLSDGLAQLLMELAASHSQCIAVDLPSGVDSDTGAMLNEGLPDYDVTLALGAWKWAHWSLPARAKMGRKRLVPIGIGSVDGAANLIEKPPLQAPAHNSNKYRRGLLAIIGGKMPGAPFLAAQSAQHAGAGYVKLLAQTDVSAVPASIVVDDQPLATSLSDERVSAALIGPGLGRDDEALARLVSALNAGIATVLDADALMLLRPDMLLSSHTLLATPHDGELDALCRAFSIRTDERRERAAALAEESGMVICAKGPDTIIATPDGRIAVAETASSWLSVAGSGDVLAGIAASRMATGCEPFEAACEAVWLHGEAARLCDPAFTPEQLADAVQSAYAACL